MFDNDEPVGPPERVPGLLDRVRQQLPEDRMELGRGEEVAAWGESASAELKIVADRYVDFATHIEEFRARK